MRMSEKCRNNNNSDNPLTSRRIDGGKNQGRGNKKPADFRNYIFTSLQLLTGSARALNTNNFFKMEKCARFMF